MPELEKLPEVGDVLMLHNCDTNDLLLCRVYEVADGQWKAHHIDTVLPSSSGPWPVGETWWGPDPASWISVTNLGKLKLEGAGPEPAV